MTRTGDPPRSTDPTGQMLERLDAHFFVQAIHVAAVLGIADLLGDDGRSVDELARATGAHGPSLSRLLRRPGHELQARLATAEPSPEQLEVAEAALAACLEREAA